MLIDYLCSFRAMSVLILCPFFELGFRSFFYIFWISVPYQIYGLQIFSTILWVAFFTVNSVFNAQNFKISLSPFCLFFFYCLFQIQCCETLVSCFLLRVLLLGLIFRSLIYFQLIFVYSVKGPTSFFCMWISSFPSTICWNPFIFNLFRSLNLKCLSHRQHLQLNHFFNPVNI